LKIRQARSVVTCLCEHSPFLYILSSLGHRIPYEADLHTMYGDRAYHELPIVHLTTARNNTKVTLTDCNGRSLCTTSCGCEGFHNARKQTTVAAQTVGISIGLKAQKLGIKDVRVKMRGIGSNRSTLSGMTLSGLNIVSLTDDTPIHYGMGRRPKKVPRK
uniref:Ribosomal protein S11 n=1 Tax=Taenia asiatica TaxID=60517 RepID=A0A0R3W812_TAEAS